MKDNKPDNPNAFPEICEHSGGHIKGMSLRDYFAAKAMQAMISRSGQSTGWSESASKQAYYIADTMLEERDK